MHSENDDSGVGRSVGASRPIFVPSSSPTPFCSDSPLTSSDSEGSPPLRHLDPAHVPSPRTLLVLKRGRAPLTVVNETRDDEPWSSFLAHHPERRSFSETASNNRSLPHEESRRQSYYEHIGLDEHDVDRGSSRGRARLLLYVSCLGLSAVLAVAPSLCVANVVTGAGAPLNPNIVVSHTLVTLCIWSAGVLLVFAVSLAAHSLARGCRRCYRKRKASLEEAVTFARETVPDYGSRQDRVNVAVLALFSPSTRRLF